jgi:hypothetical protein
MKPGPKPKLPAVKMAQGTYQACRDANRVEVIAPDSMPQRPDWLTAAGEEVWMDDIARAAQMKLVSEADTTMLLQPSGLHSIGASVRFLTDQTIPWRGQERLFSVASRLSAAARRMAPSRRFWPFARRGRPIELIRRRYGGRRGDRQPVVAVSIRV